MGVRAMLFSFFVFCSCSSQEVQIEPTQEVQIEPTQEVQIEPTQEDNVLVAADEPEAPDTTTVCMLSYFEDRLSICEELTLNEQGLIGQGPDLLEHMRAGATEEDTVLSGTCASNVADRQILASCKEAEDGGRVLQSQYHYHPAMLINDGFMRDCLSSGRLWEMNPSESVRIEIEAARIESEMSR